MTQAPSLETYRELFRKLGLEPRSSSGQNFLHSLEIAEWQVEQSNVENKMVLEVGPGTGILTKLLASKAKHVWAIENDKRLFEYLESQLKNYSNVSLILGDALKVDFPPKIEKIVSNLPYSISKKFVKRIVLNPVEEATLMVQKEFANKLIAHPGEKNYRFISFLAQTTYDIKVLKKVPKSCFYPQPHVDSVIIRMKKQEQPVINWINYQKQYVTYLEKIFERRNKKIRNALKTLPSKTSQFLGKNLPEEILETRTRLISPKIGLIILEELNAAEK